MTASAIPSTPISSSSSSSSSLTDNTTLATLVAVILISVALSLGLMGMFYVIRNKHLERRRRRRQLQEHAALPQCGLLEESPEVAATKADAEAAAAATTAHDHQRTGSDATGAATSRLPMVARPEFLIDEDISNGRELNKLPAVSYLSHDKTPLDFHYVTEFVQCEPNIHVNTELTSMNCCSCPGDCSDGDCACATSASCQKYYDSTGRLSTNYNLEAPELIRECNSACKCNRRACKNMVIQRGCRARLALFRTRSRGWGVSTLEHLKRGTFIGVYSGELVSVNSSQRRNDDTYLFNLSNNPYATGGGGGEKPKKDASADADQKVDQDRDQDQQQLQQEEQPGVDAAENSAEGAHCGEGERVGGALVDCDQSTIVTTSSGQESSCVATDADAQGEHAEEQHNHDGATETKRQDQATAEHQESQPTCTQRTLNESNYVCDAKFYGNFTRFINHSCEPNVIGIRTYTTHQDDRFPYIAFFTNRDVPAGTELTLNYGDSYWLVKCKRDKVFCLCKTAKCRFSKKTLSATMAQFNQKRRSANQL